MSRVGWRVVIDHVLEYDTEDQEDVTIDSVRGMSKVDVLDVLISMYGSTYKFLDASGIKLSFYIDDLSQTEREVIDHFIEDQRELLAKEKEIHGDMGS